ncbi:MAG: hypothetical protein LT102_00130 [Burkholderiaceae bacterium]|nr:hypothetical protein [Burkholderiaceae bacterium]
MRAPTNVLTRLAPDARAVFGLAARSVAAAVREVRFAVAGFFATSAAARFPEASATLGWNTPARPKEIKNATHARRQSRRDPPAIAISANPNSPEPRVYRKCNELSDLPRNVELVSR